MRAILSIFKYFIIILIVPASYIFVHLLDNKVLIVTDARYKHEEKEILLFEDQVNEHSDKFL